MFDLNITRVQIDFIGKGAAQNNLNNEEISQIYLFAPPIEQQKRIVRYLDKAHLKKEQKEAEAQRLLCSIDEYLLNALGSDLFEPEENTIKNRIFWRNLSNVTGRRFDPLYHFGNIYHFLKKSIYDFEYVSKVITYMKTGFASGKQNQSNDSHDIIQIRPTNINDEREFVFTKNIYIRRSELLNRKEDILQFGEILFNNTNSQDLVGKSILFDLNNPYFCSNHITRIGVHEERLNSQYLTHILNLYQRKQVFFKVCTNWNNQSGVNVNVLGQIKVPMPPLKKQLEIVDHITTIRNRSKQLRQEAEVELESAKKEVEATFLGEPENEA